MLNGWVSDVRFHAVFFQVFDLVPKNIALEPGSYIVDVAIKTYKNKIHKNTSKNAKKKKVNAKNHAKCRCFSWSCRTCSGPRRLISIGCQMSENQPSEWMCLAMTGLVINLWSTPSTTVWVFQIELHPSRRGPREGWIPGDGRDVLDFCWGCLVIEDLWNGCFCWFQQWKNMRFAKDFR